MRENTSSTLAKIIFALGVVTCLFLSACEDEDMNKLALGQQCLDDLDESSPNLSDDAEKCIGLVEGVEHQQANIIKCSAKFIQGGLTTTAISNAYKEMDNDSNTNKEAMFMTLLAFDSIESANEASKYCKDSGVSGLVYLANISVIGTQMKEALSILDGGYDPENPPSEAQLQQVIDDCKSSSSSACDKEAMGTTIVSLNESYCGTKESDHEVCGDVNQAIEQSGGDATAVAEKFFELMDQN